MENMHKQAMPKAVKLLKLIFYLIWFLDSWLPNKA